MQIHGFRIRIGRWVFSLLIAWGALAQIAPDVFQLKAGKMSGLSFFFSPIVGWICFTAAALWAVWYISAQFDVIGNRLSNLEADRGGSGLVVVSRGTDVTSVRLGEREFDFGPGAYEYYEGQRESGRDKILRQLRRSRTRTRWNKDDLEMLIDEKRRVHIMLNQFLSSAHTIKQQIESERNQRLSEPKPKPTLAENLTGLLSEVEASIPGHLRPPPLPDFELQRLGGDVTTWQREVYEYLQTEVKGYAEEFVTDLPPPPKEADLLAFYLHSMRVLEERLVKIKSRVP